MSDNGQSLNPTDIRQFLEDLKTNNPNLKPYIKSQAVPANPTENGVDILVASNFADSLKNKNAFVFF